MTRLGHWYVVRPLVNHAARSHDCHRYKYVAPFEAQTPAITGYLHGISGLVAIFGSPITFTLIGRSLARSEAQFLLSRRLLWATLLAWVGLWFFLVSLPVVGLTGQMATPLPPLVSLANRFLIVTYCIWFMAAAWSTTCERPSLTQRDS
jgi:hypothetical protein